MYHSIWTFYIDRFMRMSPETFEQLLTMVGPIVSKKDTYIGEAIGAAECLSLTIHYLAEGASQ